MGVLEELVGLYATAETPDSLGGEVLALDFRTRRGVNRFAAILKNDSSLTATQKATDLAGAFYQLSGKGIGRWTRVRAGLDAFLLDGSAFFAKQALNVTRRFAGRSH